MWRQLRVVLSAALVVVLAGCMAAAQHREDMEKVHIVARGGSIDQALAVLEAKVLGSPDKNGKRAIKTDAGIIDLLEIGALYHYAGRYPDSNEALEIVYAHYADEEMKAHISVSNIAVGAAKSLLSEGMAGSYELSGYEKVYLHTLKALNYLMLGDLDSARVEVRRGEHQHKLIEDKIAEDRAKAEKDKQEGDNAMTGVSTAQKDSSRDTFFKEAGLTAEERDLIKEMKDGYRNAMTYNLSSVVYEANREPDDAVLDLYKSYGLYSNPGVGDRFVRLAVARNRTQDRGMRDVYQLVSKQYPSVYKAAKAHPKQQSNVHVFLHTGDSPRVHALDVRFPNPVSMTMSKVSLPRYKPVPDQNYALELKSGKQRGPAGVQLDFDRLALKSFDDKLSGIYFRAIVRVVVHTVADKKLKEELGLMGQILAAVKNEALEQADTRSWTSLPKTIHYASMHADGKEVQVVVKDQSGGQLFSEQFPVEPGKITMVNIRKMGGTFITRHTLVPAPGLTRAAGPGGGRPVLAFAAP